MYWSINKNVTRGSQETDPVFPLGAKVCSSLIQSSQQFIELTASNNKNQLLLDLLSSFRFGAYVLLLQKNLWLLKL